MSYVGYWADNQNVPPDDGTPVPDSAVWAEITRGLTSGYLPYDSNTVYAVFAAGTTNFDSLLYNGGCAYHHYFFWNGLPVVYAAMPGSYVYTDCTSAGHGEPAGNSPNNDFDADAEVNMLAHEIEESTTDPEWNAWYGNNLEQENADDCAWYWGTTYNNGVGVANMNLGGKDFLIQENLLYQSGGECVQNFHNDGFYVMGISQVPSPITSAGYYYPYATLSEDSSGAVTYQWIVNYSNGVLPPDTSAWVQNGAWDFYAPSGSYTIYLYVTARDVLGDGYPTTEFLRVVCTSSASPSGTGPNLPNGCNPPPSAVAVNGTPGSH